MAAASFNSLFKRLLASYSAVGLRVVLTVPLVGLFSQTITNLRVSTSNLYLGDDRVKLCSAGCLPELDALCKIEELLGVVSSSFVAFEAAASEFCAFEAATAAASEGTVPLLLDVVVLSVAVEAVGIVVALELEVPYATADAAP